MRANTNKTILTNTILLYVRLVFVSICGLFITRFSLIALGEEDYGLFTVVGGIISFISIMNTIMISSSNRFLAIAIGKGNNNEINNQFNVCLIVHILLAVIFLLLSFPLGHFYISNYITYKGSLCNVFYIFDISVIGAVLSIVCVPYNGLLMAKEKFWVFCSANMIEYFLKFICCYILIYNFNNKIIIYSISFAILSIIPSLSYIWYCYKRYPNLSSFHLVKKKEPYLEILFFSIWVSLGALASISKTQGAILIINRFFSAAMNASLAIGNTINSLLLNLSTNVSKSIAPQITKSYAIGDDERYNYLVCLSSKTAFSLMFLCSLPFFIMPEILIKLWIGYVPDYVITFTQLLIIDKLIGALNAGTPELIFAIGKIKWYQIIESTIHFLSLIIGYILISNGFNQYSLFISFIIFNSLLIIVRQILLKKLINFNNMTLLKTSIIPSFILIILVMPLIYYRDVFSPIVLTSFSFIFSVLIIIFLFFNNRERMQLIRYLNKFTQK